MTRTIGALKVSCQLAQFGGHRHCSNRDTMVLVFHVIQQTHVTKGSDNLLRRIAAQGKSQYFQVWWSQVLWYWRYNGFGLSHNLARPCDQRVMRLYRQDRIKATYHRVKFGDHRYSGRRDTMVFVLSHDHVIKSLNDFMVRTPSRFVTILPSLMAMNTMVVT